MASMLRNMHSRCILTIGIAIVVLTGCHRGKTAASLVGEINMAANFPGAPPGLSGKLYVQGNRVRVDWGQIADVFDIRQRKGWRLIPAVHSYQELGTYDLSTYAPEMTSGSLCPHTEVPSACKLVGSEVIDGRAAKKWDVYNPKGFHVYFWTDDALQITLRMAIGDAAGYEVKNLHEARVPDSTFELPAGYARVDRR